jgi:hypothetical protein
MSRIVFAVALLFLGAEAARVGDDFKTCASGLPTMPSWPAPI